MAATSSTLILNIGDSVSRNVVIKENGVAKNITGGSIKIAIKRTVTELDVDAIFYADSLESASDITITDATNGLAFWLTDDADTVDWPEGTFIWQARYIDSAGVVSSTLTAKCILGVNIIDHE